MQRVLVPSYFGKPDPSTKGPILFIAGSGSVDGAWTPILTALQRNGFSAATTRGRANLAMASLVYDARAAALLPGYDQSKPCRNVKRLGKVCMDIQEELWRAKDAASIRVRPECQAAINRFVLKPSCEFSAFTTNWDTVLDEYLASIFPPDPPIVHIHGIVAKGHLSTWMKPPKLFADDEPGRFADSGKLYLPSEISEEPYSSSREGASLRMQHAEITQALSEAAQIVIFGLSLSPLDAELLNAVRDGIIPRTVSRVTIIDLCAQEIAARLVMLLGDEAGGLAFECFHPHKLDAPLSFTAST